MRSWTFAFSRENASSSARSATASASAALSCAKCCATSKRRDWSKPSEPGPAVTRPDPSNAAQVYEIRALLEAEAAVACAAIATPADVAHLSQAVDTIQAAFDADNSRGVLKATTDFYEVLFKIAGKSVAWSVVQSLNARINHLRAMTIATPGRSRDAIAEMRRIVAAIQKHDGDAARQASMAHVEAVAQLARQVLSP